MVKERARERARERERERERERQTPNLQVEGLVGAAT